MYETKKIDSNRTLCIRKELFSDEEYLKIMRSCKESARLVEKDYRRIQPNPNRKTVNFNAIKITL